MAGRYLYTFLQVIVLGIILNVFWISGDCFAAEVSESSIEVVFINPGKSNPEGPTGGFWHEVSSFMQAAAKDLNIDLEVLYAERNHILMGQIAEDVLSRDHLPDYLVVVNEKLAAGKIIEAADRKGVKVFSLLVDFYGRQAQIMGKPRNKYVNWIGGLVPDNRWAGCELARRLILQARAAGLASKDIKILPIAGDFVTHATIERSEGLEKAAKDFPEVVFLPANHSLWRQDKARLVTEKFLIRNPEINVIWAANDPMALGASSAASSFNRKVGTNFFVGGINWDAPALDAIKDGRLNLSVGGHFMTGGWGLVMIYDYHHGYDFAEIGGPMLKERIFDVVDNQNVDEFLKKYRLRNWDKIDFKKYSRKENNGMKKYTFCVDHMLMKGICRD